MVRISYPAVGWSKIAFKAMLNPIPGVEIFDPPEVTRDIVKIGAENSPEFVCHPFKVTLGEFINMYQKYGIDTFVQAIDCGPCRFGFYAPVQERIMKDMGMDVNIISIQQHDLTNFEFVKTFTRLSSVSGKLMKYVDSANCIRMHLIKAKWIEEITMIEGLVRCREVNKNDTTKTVKRLMEMLDKEDDSWALHSFDKVIKEEFKKMPIKRDFVPVRITIGGEMHIFLEPFVNMQIYKRFGDEGVEVHPGHSLYDWLLHKLHLNFRRKELERYAKKYIPLDIGGEAMWIVGEYIKTQKEGFDGFVHVYPFTCMPETTARGIIEGQSPDPFYMPIQFYSFDEHSGFEGMRTRMEAFIDLMQTNRRNNPKYQGTYKEPKILAEIYDKPIKSVGIADFLKTMVQPFLDLFEASTEKKEKQHS